MYHSTAYRSSDLSSTAIIIDTSRKCSKDAQGYRECISPLVCHSYVLLLSCSTVAPFKPNTRKKTKRTLVKVRVRDSAGEAVLGLDGQSLTVDLHRGQLAHQTLNDLKFRKALAAVPGHWDRYFFFLLLTLSFQYFHFIKSLTLTFKTNMLQIKVKDLKNKVISTSETEISLVTSKVNKHSMTDGRNA